MWAPPWAVDRRDGSLPPGERRVDRDTARRTCSAAPSVTVSAVPGRTVNLLRHRPRSPPIATARGRPHGSRRRARASRRTTRSDATIPATPARWTLDDHIDGFALRPHAANQQRPVAEVERVFDDQPRSTNLPDRLEHQRSRVIAAGHQREHPVAQVVRRRRRRGRRQGSRRATASNRSTASTARPRCRRDR